MIEREVADKVLALARQFPVVSVTGSRQSGKSTLVKAYLARGRKPKLFYWRDAAGHEIDILIERGASLAWAIEVKSSATYSPKFFKNLDAVCDDIDVPVERRVVVYAGQETFETSHGLVCSFADLRRLDV